MSRPYWLDPKPSRRKPIIGDHYVDVAIIGAGICGTSTAYHLAQEGVETCLIEARGVAYSATGRNAGFILQGTAERYNRAIEMLGRDRAQRIHAYSLENHRLIRETIEKHSLACGYQKRGSLQLAGSPEEEKELIESAALLQEDGFQANLLDSSALSSTYTDAGFNIAVHLPEDGELHPALFVQQVANVAESQGVVIAENSPVISIEESDTVILRTEQGAVHAEAVIVCTNARIPQLLPWFEQKVDPVRGQMLATSPAPFIFERPIYADHGYDYWRQTEDGRIVLGGWRNLDPDGEVGHAETLQNGIQENMTSFLKRFKALENIQITHRWSGIMGFSRDGLPILGSLPGSNNILVGTGFTGHGFGFAWLAGKGLAEMLLEGRHPFVEELPARRFL